MQNDTEEIIWISWIIKITSNVNYIKNHKYKIGLLWTGPLDSLATGLMSWIAIHLQKKGVDKWGVETALGLIVINHKGNYPNC